MKRRVVLAGGRAGLEGTHNWETCFRSVGGLVAERSFIKLTSMLQRSLRVS
ncbi:hypothetical protein KC19_7G071200 [Ceratodon purpureus]|uniref:Uncharacterized protein n=1 Tax=Ceratodon purpureus TaxID=3225 RepID=A0A8T0H389_CERPU|nr:hypothetical protein KC19_7G071200 [Ceratodon purpureus]